VNVQGEMPGSPSTYHFEPSLTFKFDQLRFYLPSRTGQSDPLQIMQSDSIASVQQVQNTFHVLGLNLKVSAARTARAGGSGRFSLIGLAGLGVFAIRRQDEDPHLGVRLKYGGMLVEVSPPGTRAEIPPTAVVSIDDRARLAERAGGLILHHQRGAVHHYRCKARAWFTSSPNAIRACPNKNRRRETGTISPKPQTGRVGLDR
jgi:hypothetical protein